MVAAPPAPVSPTAAPGAISRASELLPELREIFVFALETTVATQLADEPELASEARNIAAAVRTANTVKAMQALMASIKRLAYRLEFVAEDRSELRSGLIKLLQLRRMMRA